MSKTMTDQQIELLQNQQPGGPVECLGMTFENDEARREYFLEELRQKLQDPEFRKIEGFPIDEVKAALLEGGMPATQDEIKRRFDEYVKAQTKGRDLSKVRIVVE
jgi:hypothetical protein